VSCPIAGDIACGIEATSAQISGEDEVRFAGKSALSGYCRRRVGVNKSHRHPAISKRKLDVIAQQ
jgi:hypothetical protein